MKSLTVCWAQTTIDHSEGWQKSKREGSENGGGLPPVFRLESWISSKTTNSPDRDNLSTISVWVARISPYLCISAKLWADTHAKCNSRLPIANRKSPPKCHSAVYLCWRVGGQERLKAESMFLWLYSCHPPLQICSIKLTWNSPIEFQSNHCFSDATPAVFFASWAFSITRQIHCSDQTELRVGEPWTVVPRLLRMIWHDLTKSI